MRARSRSIPGLLVQLASLYVRRHPIACALAGCVVVALILMCTQKRCGTFPGTVAIRLLAALHLVGISVQGSTESPSTLT